MKKALVIMVIFQLLSVCMLAHVHMAEDIHSDYENMHVHVDDLASDSDQSSEHDGDIHAHLCVIVLDNSSMASSSVQFANPSYSHTAFSSHILTPPVPPPTA